MGNSTGASDVSVALRAPPPRLNGEESLDSRLKEAVQGVGNGRIERRAEERPRTRIAAVEAEQPADLTSCIEERDEHDPVLFGGPTHSRHEHRLADVSVGAEIVADDGA